MQRRVLTSLILWLASSAGLNATSFEKLAREWAPIFYKDYAKSLTQPETGFNPVDHPLDLFFDGNSDLRDNAESVFKLDREQVSRVMASPSIYYSVIESSTHYYITYIVYHAIDFKVFGHAHDTENVWTVLEKSQIRGEPPQLVAHITNVHGFPMIYAPDSERELRWRSRIEYGAAAKMLPWLDAHSRRHRQGDAEYVRRPRSKSLRAFIATRSHAIYKANTSAWLSGYGEGGVYLPVGCLECFSDLRAKPTDQVFEYRLLSWDQTIRELRENSSVLVASTERYPRHLPPGYDEYLPKANLFHTTSFKTPHRLADPIRMHIYFEGSLVGIAFDYLYNPYLSTTLR